MNQRLERYYRTIELLLDGKEVSKNIKKSFEKRLEKLKQEKNVVPYLAVIGIEGNDASGVVIVDLKYDGSNIEVTEDSTRDTSIKEEDRKITTNKYKKEIIKKIDDKSYWILYNNNPDEDYYIVSQVN